MSVLAVIVYLAVGLSSALLIIKVSAARPAGAAGDSRIHHVYEAAFLGGGPARVVDAALAALHADGRLAVGGPGIATVLRPVAQDPVERAVFDTLAAAPHGALHPLRREVMRSPAVQEIGDGLAARGLMMPPGHNGGLAAWGLAQTIVCMLGLPVSFALTVIEFVSTDLGEGGPPFIVLVLPALLPGIVAGSVMAARARRRVTPAGRSVLRSYQAAHAQTYDAASLVAAHGVLALPDTDLRTQLTAAAMAGRRRNRSSSYDSSYDAGSSSSYGDPVWCAGSGSGSSCGSSSCGSSSGSGSSCGGSSGSSCGSSSSSSCGGSSSSSS
ncbi:TIGR04222 domain-containing membrane protein [Streptomyces sp. NPDC002889]|uniref:TIGR04222 domain-containing membrane protein n=1 Tax=Streptomyces sp. NPDC002889 TaxID=3364669 RepID=UPI00368F5B66